MLSCESAKSVFKVFTSAMSNKNLKEALINGFAREIHASIDSHLYTQTPTDIIYLLTLFYSTPTRIFFTHHQTPSFKTKLYTSNGLSTGCFDINKNILNHNCSSLCYISNISSYSNALPQGCDAIISNTLTKIDNSQKTQPHFTSNNHLILFKSNDISQENIKCTHYSSNQDSGIVHDLAPDTKFVLCNDIGLVICTSKLQSDTDKLLALDLNKMTNVESEDFQINLRFTEFTVHDCQNAAMEYIQGESKLFIVNNMSDIDTFFHRLLHPDGFNGKKEIECGILDIDTKQCVLNTKLEVNNVCTKFGICKNNRYDAGNVYVVGGDGQVSKFNVMKEKWELILTAMDFWTPFIGQPMVWMQDDPFVLFASESRRNCKMIDIRDDKPMWIDNEELIRMINSIERDTMFDFKSFSV